MKPLVVTASSHSYEVHIGEALLGRAGTLIRGAALGDGATRCALVTDSLVAPLYGEAVLTSLRAAGWDPTVVVIPAGEASKSLLETGRVADVLINAGLDRHSFVVALGGGVVGDLAGFVASIYFRGIPLVQIPTTVVAQVDSAVGGKTGVNSRLGKNLLGTFHPPSLVIADVATLDTLPDREFNEGFGEVIKHGVIRDRALLQGLSSFERSNRAALADLIRRNVEIKAAIVAADEFERMDERALLNFGHTLGHAIEQAAGYGCLLHGEAISLGMVAAGRLSMAKIGLPTAEFDELVARLRQFQLPTTLSGEVPASAILESLARDKKFTAGRIKFVLTAALGSAQVSAAGQVSIADVEQAIADLRRQI